MAAPDFVPDSQFTPDSVTSGSPNPASQAPAFVTDSDFTPDDENIGQAVGTAAESAGKVLTLGTSPLIEQSAGKYFNIPGLDYASQQAREEAHPVASFLGAGAALATGFGGAGLITGLGGAALDAIGSKVVGSAVKYGIESALIQSTNEVGKLLADPNTTMGAAAANAGLSNIAKAGLLGAGIGGVIGSSQSLWQAQFGSKAASALDAASDAISNGSSEAPNPTGVTDLKPNADQIRQAFNNLGMSEPSTGTLSASPFVQNAESNLSQRASIAGSFQNAKYNEDFNKLTEAAKSTLTDASTQTEAQIGRANKKIISDELTNQLKPIEEQYKDLEPDFKAAKVSDDLKLQAIDPIANHPAVGLDPQNPIDPDAASLAKRISKQIEGIQDVSDVKRVRSLISSSLSKEYGTGAGGGPSAQILQTAKNALTAMRESALNEAGEAGLIDPQSAANIKLTDAQYAGFQNSLKQLGVEGGLGKPNNARALLARFNDLSDESFADKGFDPNDVRSTQFFKENFPDVYDNSRRFKLAQIQDASIDNTQGKSKAFSIAKYLTQIRKLGAQSPEALENLWGQDGQANLNTYKNIDLVHSAIPAPQNTSATNYAGTFAHFLSPEGALQNLTDAAQKAWLHALPHISEAASFAGGDDAAKLGAIKATLNSDKGTNPEAFKSAVDYIRQSIRGDSALSKAVKSIFESAPAVIPSHLIPNEESREKLKKVLMQASQGDNGINIASQVGHYLPEHATSQSTAIASASKFLDTLKPTQTQMSPLDAPAPLSKVDQDKYNRGLDVAEQPLMALQYVKNGTLLPQDVAALRSIYPSFHDSMIKKLTSEMIEKGKGQNLPYAQRVSLNMLIGGSPLDSTMSPQVMQAIIGSASMKQLAQSQATQQGRQVKASGKELDQINKVNQIYETPLQARQEQKKA